jgi:hypothetical protein
MKYDEVCTFRTSKIFGQNIHNLTDVFYCGVLLYAV